ncbi:MAG: GAF domain-containing protein [Ignavibacteriaceae bacterium]
MDRKKKNRLIIFFIFAVLIAIPIFTQDTAIRVIGIILALLYVGLIVFFRDGNKQNDLFSEKRSIDEDIATDSSHSPTEHDSSFTVINKQQAATQSNGEEIYKTGQSTERVIIKPADLKEKFEEIVNEELPAEITYDGQFSFVLEKILTILKDAYSAHTAIFFWYIKKSKKISVEKFVSSATSEIAMRKFDIENDVLSKIVMNSEPEVLYTITQSAERDIIRYYDSPQGIKSFIGVPLFYEKSLIGLLALDSKSSDTFSIDTIFHLGKAVRLITLMISIFEQKFSEFISQKRLTALLNFLKPLEEFENEEDLIASMSSSIENLLKWDAFAFVYYNPFLKKFKTTKVINNTSLKFIGENLEVELEGTLVGKCILTATHIKIDDTSTVELKRFSKVEDLSFDGSFLAIPLSFNNQIFGVLCFESLKKNSYSKSDVEFLKNSTYFLAYVLHSISNQTVYKSLIAQDIETPALNANTFKSRMESELYKAKELKIPSSVAVIKIDEFLEQESLFDNNLFNNVLLNVADLIYEEMSPFTLFGRISERTFGVHFFGASSQDVYIWSEKLRVKIARRTVSVSARQTTFTVSIGVASCTDKNNYDLVIHDAYLALQKAIDNGGNKVQKI